MKTTNTTNTANVWSFAPASVTVNGHTFEAKYSLARSGDVYVFAQVCDAPIRVHVGADMPMYADALAAAKAEPAPAPVVEPAPAPAPVQDAPKPVQDAPKPAPAKKPAKAKAAKAAPKTEPAPAPVVEPAPAPVQDAPKPAAPVEKPWIGTTITGKGWNIAFDAEAGRTRVLFQAQPTDAQKAAIEKAGFFWSNALNSWNKKLTCKAYRAAQELAAALNALA